MTELSKLIESQLKASNRIAEDALRGQELVRVAMNPSIMTFDIETVISDEGRELISKAEVSAPANYKDVEKIKAAIEEKRQAMIDKAALFWWTGKIVCITAFDFQTNSEFVSIDEDEERLLINFFNFLKDKPNRRLIGKNSDEFDSPWIRARAMRHDIGLVKNFRVNGYFSDIQKIFGWSRVSDQVPSLENMALGLNINAKKTGKGSEIAALWNDKQFDKISEYCSNDTKIVAEIFRRYEKEF